jgi:hypothetical protein
MICWGIMQNIDENAQLWFEVAHSYYDTDVYDSSIFTKLLI